MKITRKQLRRIIKEVSGQDYQNVVESIIELFYEKAESFEQYTPVSLEALSEEQQTVLFNFKPPEFIQSYDSSAMLQLNPELQEEVNEWLEEQERKYENPRL